MYPPLGCFDDKIKSMFDLSDQIFEAKCTPSDQRSDKQHEILKYYFVNTLQ